MQTNRNVIQLANKFGLKVKQTKPSFRGVNRIILSNGKHYCIKKISVTPSRLRWIDSTLHRLRRSGFPLIAWRNAAHKEGKLLFVHIDKVNSPYVLHPWVNGRWPSPQSHKDMRKCGITLARFHKAGKSFSTLKTGAANSLGRWPLILQSEHLRIKKQIARSTQKGLFKTLGSFLKVHGNEILSLSIKSQKLLRTSKYHSACHLAKRTTTLCHGDGGPTNFLFTSIGPYLIDFETLRLDLRAFDLYRVIYNSCKDHQWKFSIARAILDGYQTIAKLNPTDYKLIRVWLRFPRTTYLLLRKYNRSGPKGKSVVIRQLPIALAAERKISTFLHQLSVYAKKNFK